MRAARAVRTAEIVEIARGTRASVVKVRIAREVRTAERNKNSNSNNNSECSKSTRRSSNRSVVVAVDAEEAYSNSRDIKSIISSRNSNSNKCS
jgi:hypothetical protein